MNRTPPSPDSGVPDAVVDPRLHRSGQGVMLLWIVPLAITLVVLTIGWRAWQARSIRVSVRFDQAHGLRVGDPVRALGIEVGVVDRLGLLPGPDASRSVDDGRIEAVLAIQPEARSLLRSDTRIWIERARVGFGGVGGLDTITGPRYVGIEPGTGEASAGPFIGLEEPPVLGGGPEDLEIRLEAVERSGLRPGGVVTYRGLAIGTVEAVDLAEDARRILSRVIIEARYAPLVRTNSRFWSTSGLGVEIGLRGLRADLESLETLVAGGIGLATPDRPGEPVADGSWFTLHDRAEDDWLEWAPRIPLSPEDPAADSAR
ncbi:MAG: MlaD family protein [Planctomycetota bacterium]|nr:MlaD family protein [Planctomycetota bacterium]